MTTSRTNVALAAVICIASVAAVIAFGAAVAAHVYDLLTGDRP